MLANPAFGEFVQAFLLSFPALFSIVNPLGGAIIFNEVTDHLSHKQRVKLARLVAFFSAIVMIVALWTGTHILNFFGITLNALRIAGGLVVAVRAFEMLVAPEKQVNRKEAEAEPVEEAQGDLTSYAFFPLTLPFTTGPGTIAVTVTLATERPDRFGDMLEFFAGASIAVLAIAILIWLSYSTADRMGRLLGASGRQVVARIAAFLLLGIGVQIILSGVIPVLHSALTP